MKKKLVSLEFLSCILLFFGILSALAFKDANYVFVKGLIIEWIILSGLIYFLVKDIPLRTYLLYCFVLTLPIEPMRYNRFAFFTLWTMLLYGGWFTFLRNKFDSSKIYYIFNALCLIAIINSVWIIFQRFEIWWFLKPIWHEGGTAPNLSGVMGNSNVAGSFYGITLPAFYRKKWWMCLPLIGYALYKTNAYGGVIVAIIGTFVWLWFKFKEHRIFLLGLLGLGFVYGFIMKEFSGKEHRLNMWRVIITDYCTLKPWMGWGLGQFEVASGMITKMAYGELAEGGRWTHPHSSILKILFEQGRIGLVIAMTLVGSILYKVFKYVKIEKDVLILLSIVVASIVSATGHWLMETYVAIVPITALALLAGKVDHGNSKS